MLATLLWLFDQRRVSFPIYVAKLSLRPRGQFGAFAFILLSFGIGLVAQDVTDYLTDTDTEYEGCFYVVQRTQQAILGRESMHRFNTLFKWDREKREYKLNGLGSQVFADKNYLQSIVQSKRAGYEEYEEMFVNDPEQFVNLKTINVQTVEDGEIKDRAKSAIDLRRGLIGALYYDAKNWCYRESPNHFVELEGIQRRIDFGRSCFLLASWSVVAVIMICVARIVLPDLVRCFSASDDAVTAFIQRFVVLPGESGELVSSNRQLLRGSCVVGLLLLVCCISRVGYGHAEIVFNERAFGYHVSWRIDNQKANVPCWPSLDALLWMKASGEYAAICKLVYRNAVPRVEALATAALLKRKSGADSRPIAVVLDLDETVFDNTAFNAWLMRTGNEFSPERWEYWIKHHKDEITLVPGFLEFAEAIKKFSQSDAFRDASTAGDIEVARGVGAGDVPPSGDRPKIHLVFISNRSAASADVTFETLQNLGVVSKETNDNTYRGDYLFLQQGSDSSKVDRRKEVNEIYDVIAYFGDNLADFDGDYERKNTPDFKIRRNLVIERDDAHWGRDWFVLPNPLYGDWRSQLSDKDVGGIIEP